VKSRGSCGGKRTVPSQSTTAAALFLNEQKLTWALYYGDSSQSLPWLEINAGTLTPTKAC
jgi:hypothetical protein